MNRHLTITVVRNGPSRLVDRGRPGLRNLGIATGGAADPVAHRAVNQLLGRAAYAPCIEMDLVGGSWLLAGRGSIALTGADMNWRLNGHPVDTYSVLYLDGDYLLVGRQAVRGCRSYLGAKGRWAIPTLYGSVEPGLPGAFTLNPGATVRVSCAADASFRNAIGPTYANHLTLPGHPAPEYNLMSDAQRDYLFTTEFTVARSSNRQGLRLVGDGPAPTSECPSLLSSGVLPGTVQLAPAGPILLGPDAQTIGGYPRVLQVDDWSPAFQLLPGQRIRFNRCDS
jgi:allophanate hydrolase subunit 2